MHVLITRRLTLRRPAILDADEIALWLSNWNVTRMLGVVPYPYDRRDAEEWLESLKGKPEGFVYTIHRERLIGVVSIEGEGPEPQLGYWLAEPWHGRGFMTEAAGAVVAHALETRPLTGIASSVFVDNRASLRVQEKLGFTLTGADESWCRSRGEPVARLLTRLDAAACRSKAAVPALSAA